MLEKMKPFVLDEPVNGTFWPELNPLPLQEGDYGTGYYNVLFVEEDKSLTGYRFDYIFIPEGARTYHFISSLSLPRLRKRVLMSDLPWKVIDVHTAMETLSMNLLDMHYRSIEIASRLHNHKFSGVAYVRRISDSHMKNGYFWKYSIYCPQNHGRYNFSAATLIKLKEKAEFKDVPWIVTDEEVYNKILEKESHL